MIAGDGEPSPNMRVNPAGGGASSKKGTGYFSSEAEFEATGFPETLKSSLSLFSFQELGVEKNDLQVPLFGELRRYRQAIIHNRGIATAEVEECVVLKGPRPGERLLFHRNLFEEIIDAILAFLHGLQERPEQFIRRA